MKAKFLSLISLLLVIFMLFCTLISCAPAETDGKDSESEKESENTTPPVTDEYFLPKEEGYNQITFYLSGFEKIMESSDIWCWWDGKDGKGYTMYPCSFGAKVMINIPEGVEEVGFIVRTSCSDPGGSSWGQATKDATNDDRFAVIVAPETAIYLKRGDATQYKSDDGGKTLTMTKEFSFASLTDFNTIKYTITPAATLNHSQVKVYEGDREISVTALSSANRSAKSGDIVLAETLDISKSYRVEIEGYGACAVVPTSVFDSEYFIENLTYDGDDLGATINGDNTTFKVWAPTASSVVLNLFTAGDGGEAYESVSMTKGDRGVWSHTAECAHGTYYTYSVTTSVGTQEAVDPYAKAAGVNGNRGMVVDLSLTNPEGFGEEFSTGIDSYSDAIIWEVHVRDFSNKIASSNYKGKYLAFTERGLVNEYGEAVGVDYLVELGITHVHLLPVYDYATVDETESDGQFNWGYDPKNYNVPEGSYSTNPYDGAVRIKEYKEMVLALHKAGIGVIMDMVYNHTHDANSSFNKIVPYYYYRYNENGTNTSASGCGNDTASERYMYGKFMVDSVKYWAEEYDLDGFRFDLMGLHDLDTMQEIEAAVHTVNPEAIIYGEGWTMGATIDGSLMANQSQIKKIEATGDAIGTIAVFNDVIRDGLKGSVFSATGKGYISGNASLSLNAVLFGIGGGSGGGASWSVNDSMVINYMSAHDNNTLWDKLELSNGSDPVEARLAMNRLGATLIMISKGTPFFQAGEEMLRTKGGDENSYKSSDAVNNIDWSVLQEGTDEYEMMLYYKELIKVRKSYELFTSEDTEIIATELTDKAVAITLDGKDKGVALVVANPNTDAMSYVLDGEWLLLIDGVAAREGEAQTVSGTIDVPAYSAIVLIKK